MFYFLIFLKIFVAIYLIGTLSSSFDISASYLSKNLPSGVKGPTINAIASSLPELIISFIFLFYYKDIIGFSSSYATIIGSAAFNISIIPSISLIFFLRSDLFRKIEINKLIILQDSIFNLISIFMLGMIFYFGTISYFTSILLIFVYIIYIYFIFKFRTKLNLYNKEIEIRDYSNLKNILYIKIFSLFNNKINRRNCLFVLIISLTIIGISCYILTISCEELSLKLGIDLYYISFFIAAIASSIPDTFLSIYDAKKGNIDDAYSNAFASNIFDICIGLSLPLFIYTLIYGPLNLFDSEFLYPIFNSLILLFMLTFVISLIYYFGKISLFKVIIVLITYLIFIKYLVSIL